MTNVYFSRCQHAVGQGCFHSGDVSNGERKLHYVYDCGSTSTGLVNYAVDEYLESLDGDIDLLFISHFDKDHVAGLSRLLVTKVTTAVIPYLSPFERLRLIARSATQGTLDTDELLFVIDPVRWLSDRGVSRIVLVSPEGGDRPKVTRGDYPYEPASEEKPDINFKGAKDISREFALPSGVESPEILLLDHTSPITMSNVAGKVIWEFLTYVHPEPELTVHFANHVRAVFQEIADISDQALMCRALLPLLSDKSKRNRLKSIYKTTFGDVNCTSMSLYSGPPPHGYPTRLWIPFQVEHSFSGGQVLCEESKEHGAKVRRNNRGGWIATGDAELAREDHREKFEAHYREYFDRTTIMSLPHHGSIANFHRSLIGLGVPVYVVSAKAKSKHHPNKNVITMIRMQPGLCYLTTGDRITQFVDMGEVIMCGD